MATSNNTPTESDDFITLVGNVFKLYNESWEALKLNLTTFIVLALIPAVLVAVSVPFVLLPFYTDGGTLSVLVTAVMLVGLFVLGAIFLPALTVAEIESARGNKIDVNQVFERSKSLFLPFLGVLILSGLAIVFGLIFFIIPGLAALFFFALATYIVVDKKLGVIESLKASYELTKAKWQWVAALFIVQFALSLVSYIPLIGWIISIALSIVYFCLPAIVYVKITNK